MREISYGNKKEDLATLKSTSVLPAGPRFRTDLLTSQLISQGSDTWHNVVLGGDSTFNVNEMPESIGWDSENDKIEFNGETTVNYLFQLDLYLTGESSLLDILGNTVCGPEDELWYRFYGPHETDPIAFPLPETKQASKLGGFARSDSEYAVSFQQVIYASPSARDKGLQFHLKTNAYRDVTLADAVLIVFPI